MPTTSVPSIPHLAPTCRGKARATRRGAGLTTLVASVAALSAALPFVPAIPAAMPSTGPFTLTDPAPQAGARFGNDADLVDLNADGHTDLIVGAPGYDNMAFVDTGCILIGTGPLGVAGTPTSWLRLFEPTGTAAVHAQFGYRMVDGDFNGDGAVDLAVSAPGREVDNHPGVDWDQGVVWVLYGPWNFANPQPYSFAVPLVERTFTFGGASTSQRINDPALDLHGDRFGERLARCNVMREPGEDGLGKGHELLVGAPFSSLVNGGIRYRDRGQAYLVIFDPMTGLPAIQDEFIATQTLGGAPIFGQSIYLGFDLASGDLKPHPVGVFDEVAIGCPGAPGKKISGPGTAPFWQGFVPVYHDWSGTGFDHWFVSVNSSSTPTLYSGVHDELFFGFELAIGHAAESRNQNGYDTLFVGAPCVGATQFQGLVYGFPGGSSTGPGTIDPNNPFNFWFNTVTGAPSHMPNRLNRFGAGLELVFRGNNYQGNSALGTLDLALAPSWHDVPPVSPLVLHGEGTSYLVDVTALTTIAADTYFDPSPEQLPRPVAADPDEDQFERMGFGNAALISAPILKPSGNCVGLLIGNPSATDNTLSQAGELHLVLLP